MVHISKLSIQRISSIEDAVQIRKEIYVKVTDIDESGRINPSHIDALRMLIVDRNIKERSCSYEKFYRKVPKMPCRHSGF